MTEALELDVKVEPVGAKLTSAARSLHKALDRLERAGAAKTAPGQPSAAAAIAENSKLSKALDEARSRNQELSRSVEEISARLEGLVQKVAGLMKAG